jgi:hypothetical protein
MKTTVQVSTIWNMYLHLHLLQGREMLAEVVRGRQVKDQLRQLTWSA